MGWLTRALIGPGLWAVGFAAVYGLHGIGCAQGWTEPSTGISALRLAMGAVWVVTLGACLWLLWRLPVGLDLPRRLPRAGAWIGLGATAFTQLPLLVATSC